MIYNPTLTELLPSESKQIKLEITEYPKPSKIPILLIGIIGLIGLIYITTKR